MNELAQWATPAVLIAVWVRVESIVHALRVESNARHEENLRRFERLEAQRVPRH